MPSDSSHKRNIVLLLTDQQRDGGPYEPAGMADFRSRELGGFNQLCERGIRFTQHRINSSACVPSRASMLTGYSPWVHGVMQTDGLAKRYDDPAQEWLPHDRVPTLGHRMKAAGWQCAYFGKWHLSHEDLAERSGETSTEQETRYLSANPLGPYGFDRWVGPEPHGAKILNSGVCRDDGYVDQAKRYLQARAQDNDGSPFLMVLSLVNPHDIVFWPAWSLWKQGLLDVETIGSIGDSPTKDRLACDEPAALQAYRERYGAAYGPAKIVQWIYRRDPERYCRFYASLIRRADRHISEILAVLDSTGLMESTHVVCTSDHGELLGSHGNLHQKWYNAYEETLRVPMVISSPDSARRWGSEENKLTTHLDLVPTILGLAGIDAASMGPSNKFEREPPLLGRDILSDSSECSSYFMTQDNILAGQTPEAAFGRRFPWFGALWPMRYPDLGVNNHAVEAVVGFLPEDKVTPWKLVRYFDPKHVGEQDSDEWMLFNLSQDPVEGENLAKRLEHSATRDVLAKMLAEERMNSMQDSVGR